MITTYPGGKNGSGVFQRIINELPPHRTYIELFLGSGAILRRKRPAECSIGIDIDAAVTSQWSVCEIPNTKIIRANALEWLASTTIARDTLIYLDPPYLISSRSTRQLIYRYEFSEIQHTWLLSIIKRLDCLVIISGYASEMYATELAEWRTIQFNTQTRGGKATEHLWMNYPAPSKLHDYSYLGDNYRERERIKLKIIRWTTRLSKMDPLERAAILDSIHRSATTETADTFSQPGSTTVPSDSCRRIPPSPAMSQTIDDHQIYRYGDPTTSANDNHKGEK